MITFIHWSVNGVAFYVAGYSTMMSWRAGRRIKKNERILEDMKKIQQMPLNTSLAELARYIYLNKSNMN